MQLNLSHISYTYPGATAPALKDASATFPLGWTGIIGDNGCGKTTLAQIAAGIIKPDRGSVSSHLFCSYCQQDSTLEPINLQDFASDWSREAQQLRDLLLIEDDWLWRYETLSGGQQKRIQIACALFARPDVLVMDEPTNDLDITTRTLVKNALATFTGIGILISHDRDLLDSLVSQSLLCEAGRWIMRTGGYSKASAQADSERVSTLHTRENALRETKRLKAEAQRRNEEASRQKGLRSKSGLAKKDSDARERIGRAIVSGKDGIAGKLSTTMNRRVDQAESVLNETRITKRYDPQIGDYGVASRSKIVVHSAKTSLNAGDFSIAVPELWITPTDHITLTGSNGTGKSLIVHHILQLIPDGITTAFIPQRVEFSERERALSILAGCDQKMRGQILSIVARLNSDPDRLLDGSDVSPGELRKLMLAEQLLKEPNLLVLDEPTNHLDIGSIEALENMLKEFAGAVLLVTHDRDLAHAVANTKWQTCYQDGAYSLEIE